MMLRQAKPLQVILLLCVLKTNADVPRPRGVSLEQASLYHPKAGTDKWTCLDGSKTISFKQINDDYCDCLDASDEPGTAACAKGTFHCENAGYRSVDVPSSRVNDGICDCCDGSDEYATNVACDNKCFDLGRAEQEHLKNKADLHKRGAAKRAELIARGKQLRNDREARRIELEQRRLEQTALKEEKLQLQQQAEAAESEALQVFRELQSERESEEAAARAKAEEEPQSQRMEAEAHFVRYDTNKDGFVEVTELQVDMTLDRDRNGVVTVEEAKYFLDDRERIDLDAFSMLSWPRIKSLKMLAEGIFKPPRVAEDEQAPIELNTAGDAEEKILDNENHDEQDAEDTDPEEVEEHDEFEEDADVGVGTVSAENKPQVDYDPETQRLVDLADKARQESTEAQSQLSQTEREIQDIDEYNNRDYGAQDEYAALHGECFTFEDREYVYSLCPFDKTTQKSRSGGGETFLGRWDQWLAEGDNKYAKQKYSHGSSCWNGPQRSAIVSIRCALESQVLAVSEPNRCEYYFEFETPAACDDSIFNTDDDESVHDEL